MISHRDHPKSSGMKCTNVMTDFCNTKISESILSTYVNTNTSKDERFLLENNEETGIVMLTTIIVRLTEEVPDENLLIRLKKTSALFTTNLPRFRKKICAHDITIRAFVKRCLQSDAEQ